MQKDTRSVAWSLGYPIDVKRGDPDFPTRALHLECAVLASPELDLSGDGLSTVFFYADHLVTR